MQKVERNRGPVQSYIKQSSNKCEAKKKKEFKSHKKKKVMKGEKYSEIFV